MMPAIACRERHLMAAFLATVIQVSVNSHFQNGYDTLTKVPTSVLAHLLYH